MADPLSQARQLIDKNNPWKRVDLGQFSDNSEAEKLTAIVQGKVRKTTPTCDPPAASRNPHDGVLRDVNLTKVTNTSSAVEHTETEKAIAGALLALAGTTAGQRKVTREGNSS